MLLLLAPPAIKSLLAPPSESVCDGLIDINSPTYWGIPHLKMAYIFKTKVWDTFSNPLWAPIVTHVPPFLTPCMHHFCKTLKASFHLFVRLQLKDYIKPCFKSTQKWLRKKMLKSCLIVVV